MKIKVVYAAFAVLLLSLGTNGRYMGKFGKVTSGTNEQSESFQNLIRYYRSQGRSADIGSVETNDKSAEDVDEQNYGKYRIDLNSDAEYIPAASYAYEQDVPTFDQEGKQIIKRPEPIVQTVSAIVQKEKTEQSTSESTVPLETKTPETIESEATTEIPVDKAANTEFRNIIKFDDDAPPGFEIEQLGPQHHEDEENDDESEECVEGKIKKKECNTCVCVEGNYFCSKKVCTNVNATTPAPGTQEKKHEELNQKVKDSWGKKKPQSSTPVPQSQCSSGQTKSINCNQCICAMGKWACTKRSCIALTLREKASYTGGSLLKEVDALTENKDLDDDCSEAETRQVQCNQCVCHLNSWSCTKLECAPTPPPRRAEDIQEACQRENDVKSRDCNLCKCTRGLWVCTRNDCKFPDHDAAPPSYRSSSKITKIRQNYH